MKDREMSFRTTGSRVLGLLDIKLFTDPSIFETVSHKERDMTTSDIK